jgi:two-component system chemotaxis response regulator CheY
MVIRGVVMDKKILIVDDAPFMRRMIRDILEKNDFEVIGESEDGEVAVRMYNDLHPDLVIMDITMPKMDGITAVREIMKTDSNAKIIICSAIGQQPMVIESILAGAKDFIVKPFEAVRVVESINYVLENKRH